MARMRNRDSEAIRKPVSRKYVQTQVLLEWISFGLYGAVDVGQA